MVDIAGGVCCVCWYWSVLQRHLLLPRLTVDILPSRFASKMSSKTTTCPGCDHIFSLRGHLALSQDPLCRAVFDKLSTANDAHDADMPFQADAFRTAEDYRDASDMFGQKAEDDKEVDADDPPPLISDDEDDDEEDDDEDDDEGDEDFEELEMANMVAELEKSWEPPRQGVPCQEAVEDEADDLPPHGDEDDNDNDNEGAPHHAPVDNLDIVRGPSGATLLA